MNKNLEIEYKKHIENEIPDLWNRIEEALPSKNIDSNDSKVIAFDESKKTKSKKVNMKAYAGIIAACICCAISIPAFLYVTNSSKSESTATAAAASDESYESEAAFEEVYESEAAFEEVYESEDACEEAADVYESAAVNETVNKSAAIADDATMEDAAVAANDMAVISDIHISVSNIYEENEKHYATVKIIEDPSGQLNVDDIVDVDVTSYVIDKENEKQLPFSTGDTLTVELIRQTDNDTGKDSYSLMEITDFK